MDYLSENLSVRSFCIRNNKNPATVEYILLTTEPFNSSRPMGINLNLMVHTSNQNTSTTCLNRISARSKVISCSKFPVTFALIGNEYILICYI